MTEYWRNWFPSKSKGSWVFTSYANRRTANAFALKRRLDPHRENHVPFDCGGIRTYTQELGVLPCLATLHRVKVRPHARTANPPAPPPCLPTVGSGRPSAGPNRAFGPRPRPWATNRPTVG